MWETFAVFRGEEEFSRLGDAWDAIKTALATKLSAGAYQNWISRTTLASVREGDLTIRVPDETTEAWIRQEYTTQIRNAVEELKLPVRRIEYIVEKAPPTVQRRAERCVQPECKRTFPSPGAAV